MQLAAEVASVVLAAAQLGVVARALTLARVDRLVLGAEGTGGGRLQCVVIHRLRRTPLEVSWRAMIVGGVPWVGGAATRQGFGEYLGEQK